MQTNFFRAFAFRFIIIFFVFKISKIFLQQYQNIAAMSMPKKVVGVPMQPKYAGQHGVPLQLNIDSQHAQYSEDLLPPPSPVSSSYSELRRATENPYPTMPIYPSTSHHPQHTYANIYHSDYAYTSYQPSNLRQVYR